MEFANIATLDTEKFMIIDKATGTVLDCDSLVLVPVPRDSEDAESVTMLDSAAFDYAEATGTPLFVRSDELPVITDRAASYEF